MKDAVGVLVAVLASVGAAPARDEAVPIRGGTFLMGTPPESIPELKRRFGLSFRGAFEEESPAHRVTLSDFRMDAREVTHAQFSRFVTERPEWAAAFPSEGAAGWAGALFAAVTAAGAGLSACRLASALPAPK